MSQILVTGCSRGIGHRVAEHLAAAGHHVIATARDVGDLNDLNVAERLTLDVTDDASVAAAARAVDSLDVLINNAGIALQSPVEHTPLGAAQDLFDINVFGLLRTTQAFLPALRRGRQPTVINVSSVVGRVGMPLVGAYAASKWAVEGLSEAMALELEREGITVKVLEPGYVSSGGVERSATYFGPDPSKYAPLVEALQATGQNASTTQDVAEAIQRIVDGREGAFRVPVGPGADGLLQARAGLNDEDFTAALKGQLGLT